MAYNELIKILQKFLKRNQIILVDFTRAAQPKKVNLHWWEPSGEEHNLGDYLSWIIVDFMKKKHSVDDNRVLARTRHLYAVGSIIDGGYQDATIWGSGIIRGNRLIWWRKIRKLDVRAVRGPETRKVLMENGYSCPEVYGDPAILMPLIYTPKAAAKEYDYRVIQNHSLNQAVENSLSPVTGDWMGFIDELTKSNLIISSSLHGIILAEAYGIPAVLLKSSLDLFKFRDYYHATGRYDFPVAASIEEALHMQPAPLPDLDGLRQGLLDSFPVDLWKN